MQKQVFPDGIAYEQQCEQGGCSMDAITFKGFVHRWWNDLSGRERTRGRTGINAYK